MSELKVMHSDVTKSADDKDNYQTEFAELVNQMQVLDDAEFNGVNLFEGDGVTASNLEVSMVEDGSSTMTVSQSQLNDTGTAVNTITSGTLDSLSVGQFTDAIAEVATQRATNGAQQSRLQFASEMLEVNRQNLEAANSRIVDTDIARESTEYARANILVQSGTAMLAQANQSSQVALRLLG
jgi:flagellin